MALQQVGCKLVRWTQHRMVHKWPCRGKDAITLMLRAAAAAPAATLKLLHQFEANWVKVVGHCPALVLGWAKLQGAERSGRTSPVHDLVPAAVGQSKCK